VYCGGVSLRSGFISVSIISNKLTTCNSEVLHSANNDVSLFLFAETIQ